MLPICFLNCHRFRGGNGVFIDLIVSNGKFKNEMNETHGSDIGTMPAVLRILRAPYLRSIPPDEVCAPVGARGVFVHVGARGLAAVVPCGAYLGGTLQTPTRGEGGGRLNGKRNEDQEGREKRGNGKRSERRSKHPRLFSLRALRRAQKRGGVSNN